MRSTNRVDAAVERNYASRMRQKLFGLGIFVGFAAGCATAQFVVPPARAASLEKWEYLCFIGANPASVQEKANQAGAEGWELVGAAGSDIWCAKRPK
jgi:hypothetical protein